MAGHRTALMLATVTLMAALGCDARPENVAVAGAPPFVDTPLGPLPGPEELDSDVDNPFAEDRVALTEGRRLFVRFNCAGCHGGHGGGGMGPNLRDESWIRRYAAQGSRIRGTPAIATVGPDLTHVASRSLIAGGMLENSVSNLHAWVTHAQAIKTGTAMPDMTAFTGRGIACARPLPAGTGVEMRRGTLPRACYACRPRQVGATMPRSRVRG